MPQPDEGAPALRLEGVRRSFRSGKRVVVAIDGVTASAARGAVTGLIGPDGAGKTTLMRLIAGLLLPGNSVMDHLEESGRSCRIAVRRCRSSTCQPQPGPAPRQPRTRC